MVFLKAEVEVEDVEEDVEAGVVGEDVEEEARTLTSGGPMSSPFFLSL